MAGTANAGLAMIQMNDESRKKNYAANQIYYAAALFLIKFTMQLGGLIQLAMSSLKKPVEGASDGWDSEWRVGYDPEER